MAAFIPEEVTRHRHNCGDALSAPPRSVRRGSHVLGIALATDLGRRSFPHEAEPYEPGRAEPCVEHGAGRTLARDRDGKREQQPERRARAEPRVVVAGAEPRVVVAGSGLEQRSRDVLRSELGGGTQGFFPGRPRVVAPAGDAETTGKAQAIASSVTLPNASVIDGLKKTSVLASARARSSPTW